jgi:hypothetical protein
LNVTIITKFCKAEKDDKKKRAGSTVPDGMLDLKLAEDVCKGALSLSIPAAYKRALLATLARVQVYTPTIVFMNITYHLPLSHLSPLPPLPSLPLSSLPSPLSPC